MERKLADILIDIGITPNLKGFDYIIKAVKYIFANMEVKICDVYEHVAKENGSNKSSVERVIRHAIAKSDKDCETWRKYIGVRKITNAAVLYTLAFKIMEEYEDE